MADFKMKLPGITDKDLENSLDKLIEKATTAKKETEQLVNSGEKAIKSLENTATAVSSTVEKAVRKTTSETTKAVDLTIKQLKRLNNMKIGVKDGKSMMSYSRAYSQLFGEKEIKALEANEKKYNRTLELAKKSINDYREFVEKTQNEFEKYDGSGSTEPLVKGLYDEKAVEEITNKYIEKLKESNVKVTKIKNDIIYREKAYSAYKTLQTEGTKIGTPKTIEDMKSLLEIMSKQVILARKIKSLTDNIGYSDKKYDDMKLLDVEQNIRQFFTKASGNEYINKFFKDLVDTVETEYNSFNEKIQKVATERDFSGFMEVPVKAIKKGFDESLKLAESYVKKLDKLTTNSFTGKGRNAFYNLNKIPDSNISEESKWSLVGQMSSLLAQGGNVNKESGGYQYYEKLLAESEEFANFATEVTRQVKENMESGWKEFEKVAVPEGVQNPVVVEKKQADALEKKADAQKKVNEFESIYARAQKIRNEGNVTDYDGNDWNYSKTMLYKYYDGIIELQSKISKTTDAHILDDLNKDLDESKVEFVALYDTIDAFFEGKLNSRSIKANVRNLFNQLAPQSDIDAYIKMITSSDNTHPVIQTPQIDNATSKVDSNNRANPDINSLPLFNEESTGQLAMQIEGVTEASWDLGKAEKSVTEDIQFMNTALEGQIELVEVLESKLNDKRSIIQDKIDSYTQDYNTDTERLSNALMQDNEGLNILWIENMYKAMARDFNSIEENKKALAELNNEVYEMKQITAVDARNIIFDEVAKKANLALYYIRELSDAEKEYLTSNNKAKKAGNVAELYDQYNLLLDINDEIEHQYGNFKTKSRYIDKRMNEMSSNGHKTRGIGKYLKARFGEEYDKKKSEFIQMREDIIKLNPVLKQFRKQYREWIYESGVEISTPQHLTQDDFVKKFLGQFEYKDTFSDFQSTILQALQKPQVTSNTTAPLIEQAQAAEEVVKANNDIVKSEQQIERQSKQLAKQLAAMYSVVNPETINKVAGMLSEKFRNSESLKVDENGFINTDVIDEFELFTSAPPSFESIFDVLAHDADFFIEKIDGVSEVYKKLREYVSHSKILIDSKLKNEFGDKKEWDRIRTTIGMNTMTTNSNIGTPINKFLEEMNEALGTSFDITGSAQDGIRHLFNELEKGRNGISQLDEQIKNREIKNIEEVTNTFIANQEKISRLNGKKISAPNPRIYQIKQEASAIEEQIPVIEEQTQTIVENTNAKKKNRQSKEDTNLLRGSYTIADGDVEELLRRKVAEINKTTGMEKAKYRILTDAQNEVLSAEISYVNKELGQVVTEMYALHKANEEIEGDEDALIFKGKKLSQDTIAAEEKKQKAIEATNEALRQQLERIKNIDTKVEDPKNNINNISDIETLAYAKNDALNKISSLQGSSNATKSDIGEVKNLVNEYERVTNEIIKATQLSSKQISSDDNIVRIESLITNITKLIEKTKEYAGTSIKIDNMIKSLEKEQKVLRKTSDILQGKSKDDNGNILSMSSKDASDKYYSALSNYKKNAAVFDQFKIEQDKKEKQKAQDYQFLIDKINELAAARKKLQSLESNARKNPTLDYSAEIQQQKDLIQTLERVVELNKVDFNTMSSDGDFWNVDRINKYTDALNKAETAEKDLNNQRQLFNEKDQQIAIDNYKKALSDLVNTYKSFASNANGNSNLSIQINAQQIADAQQRVRELGDAAEKAGVSASDLENLFTNSFTEISSSVGTIGTKTLDGYINKINTLSGKMEENGTATDKTRLRIDELKKSISSIIKNADFSTDEGIGSFLAQIESVGRKLPSILSEIESLGKFDSKMLSIDGSIQSFDKLNLQTIKAKSLLTSLKNEYKSLQDSLAKNNGQFGKEQIEQLTRIDALVSKISKEAYGKGTLVPETTGNVKDLQSLETTMINYAKAEWNAQQVGETLQTKTGELVGTFKTEDGTIHKLTVGMNSLSNSMNVVKDEVGQSTGFFKEMKNTLTGMGKRFSYIFSGYVLFHKMTSAFRDGLNVLKEYDSALTTISYTMDLTKNQLGKLGDSAVQMAKDLSMSLDNAMSIYQIYANMNTTAQEINETATPTAILSNLSGVDTSTASDQVQGILQQFSMLKDGANTAADASMHVVDVLDKISANVAIDYAKGIGVITDAVTATGQVAYDAGLSFEQLAAISAKVAERTREDGSTIGGNIVIFSAYIYRNIYK